MMGGGIDGAAPRGHGGGRACPGGPRSQQGRRVGPVQSSGQLQWPRPDRKFSRRFHLLREVGGENKVRQCGWRGRGGAGREGAQARWRVGEQMHGEVHSR